MTENNAITIKFSEDKAVVLFEFLSRFNAKNLKKAKLALASRPLTVRY